MPVGTKGAVRHLSSADLADLGVQIVLGNTYHLMLKPGADVIGALGRPARLRRLVRPRPHRLRRLPDLLPRARRQRRTSTTTASPSAPPTTAARTASPRSRRSTSRRRSAATSRWCSTCARRCRRATAVLRSAVDRTAAWAARARAAFLAQERPELNQFGIVQGGTDLALRAESAERTARRRLRRLRDRRAVGRRVARRHARDPGGDAAAPARRPAPLPDGPR